MVSIWVQSVMSLSPNHQPSARHPARLLVTPPPARQPLSPPCLTTAPPAASPTACLSSIPRRHVNPPFIAHAAQRPPTPPRARAHFLITLPEYEGYSGTTRVSEVDLPAPESCFGHLGARSLTRAATPPSEEREKRLSRTNPEEGAV